MKYRKINVVVADDDQDDIALIRSAFRETERRFDNQLSVLLHIVEDGQALMDYLYRRGKYENPALSPAPALILLDLNMPRKDGREALREIRSDGRLRTTPVVVLTTSDREDEIRRSYSEGANTYIIKPPTFQGLVKAVTTLRQYWFNTVSLPDNDGRKNRWGRYDFREVKRE
jgi:CheY-like chemotaxis protein